MKIWYPVVCKPKADVQVYISVCQSRLADFKRILRQHINKEKLKVIQTKIPESTVVKVTESFSAQNTLETFINSLTCRYEPSSRKCFYTVSDLIPCKGTNRSLNFMIKLFEFGNGIIPPLAWLRHSYVKFKELIQKEDEQNE